MRATLFAGGIARGGRALLPAQLTLDSITDKGRPRAVLIAQHPIDPRRPHL